MSSADDEMALHEPLNDGAWITRCVAHMVALDPLLEPEFARPIAADMSVRPRWRGMLPEDAAQAVFDIGKKPGR